MVPHKLPTADSTGVGSCKAIEMAFDSVGAKVGMETRNLYDPFSVALLMVCVVPVAPAIGALFNNHWYEKFEFGSVTGTFPLAVCAIIEFNDNVEVVTLHD